MELVVALGDAAVDAEVRAGDFADAVVETGANVGWLAVVVRVAKAGDFRVVYVLGGGEGAVLLFVLLFRLARAQEDQGEPQALHRLSILRGASPGAAERVRCARVEQRALYIS